PAGTLHDRAPRPAYPPAVRRLGFRSSRTDSGFWPGFGPDPSRTGHLGHTGRLAAVGRPAARPARWLDGSGPAAVLRHRLLGGPALRRRAGRAGSWRHQLGRDRGRLAGPVADAPGVLG